jgi:phage shock protein A
MRLFRRIGDIVAANLNELVDRFEDPELMLNQAIREMETMIESATTGAARAIAADRLLARDLLEHEHQIAKWSARAEEAVERGDDDLARQAISRAHEHEAIGRALGDERRASERAAQFLRSQIDAMRAKLAEARRKAASISAARQRATNVSALDGSVGLSLTGFARFDRLRHRLDCSLFEAEALTELRSGRAVNPDADVDSREHTRRIEEALKAIKNRQSSTASTHN